jgi:hypothetical protein
MAGLESTKLINLTKSKFVNRLGKLGNNTYARYDPEKKIAAIYLHGSLIATLQYGNEADEASAHIIVFITDAGYGTNTTRDRLSQILSSNGIPFAPTQHKYEQVLRSRNWEDKRNYWYVSPHSNQREAIFVQQTPESEWEYVERY